MEIKHLLCAGIFAMASTNVLALQIQHGKLIEKREWTTGNASIGLPNKSSPRAIPKQAFPASYYYLQALIRDVKSFRGQVTEIPVQNHIQLQNISNENVRYRYIYEICSENSDYMTHCVHSWKEIELQPGGSFADAPDTTLQMKYEKAGKYTLETKMFFADDDSSDQIMSTSSATITVS